MKLKRAIQRILQIGFLILFILLTKIGKVQLWMGIFLLGILASFLLGRIFCGWACTINTVLKGVTWLKKKLHLKSIKIPNFLMKPWVRFLAIVLFIGLFILTMTAGQKLPVMHVLLIIAVILTFLFPEELWHRFLCPYGTILSLSSSKTRHGMKIDSNSCTNCGVCKAVCPAKAVEKKEGQHEIIKKDCLVCMECSIKCRQKAISYK